MIAYGEKLLREANTVKTPGIDPPKKPVAGPDRSGMDNQKRIKVAIAGGLSIFGAIGSGYLLEMDTEVIVAAIWALVALGGPLIAGLSWSDSVGKGKIREAAEQRRYDMDMPGPGEMP